MAFGLISFAVSSAVVNNSLNKAVEPLNAQIVDLNEEIAEKEAMIIELQSSKAELESRVVKLESDITVFEEEKANLTAVVEELNKQIAELDESIADLQSAKLALENSVAGLENSVAELENKNADLTAKITALKSCLNEKHVVDEAQTISYVYTWSDIDPASTIVYTCLHCEREIEENLSPSVWRANDKVTYIAKDGNSYESTVVEVVDGKAVLLADDHKTKKLMRGEFTAENVEAVVTPVGARLPIYGEVAWTDYIAPWQKSLPNAEVYSGPSHYYGTSCYNNNKLYVYFNRGGEVTSSDISGWGFWYSQNTGSKNSVTVYCRYIWDVTFATAE
jgi:exonuclease VII small subunit